MNMALEYHTQLEKQCRVYDYPGYHSMGIPLSQGSLRHKYILNQIRVTRDYVVSCQLFLPLDGLAAQIYSTFVPF